MKYRPRKLLMLCVFLLFVGISQPIQLFLEYRFSPLDIVQAFARMSPLNWIIFILAPITALHVFQASVWALGTVPALTWVVLRNNTMVAEMALNANSSETLVASLGFIFAVGSLAGSTTRDLFLYPELRWWRTPKRKKVQLAIELDGMGAGYTFDVSETGVFLPRDQFIPQVEAQKAIFGSSTNSNVVNPKVGARYPITLFVDSDREIHCTAEVVRVADPNGHYPAGIGLKFLKLDKLDRNTIREHIAA